jgi:hypothetical protein
MPTGSGEPPPPPSPLPPRCGSGQTWNGSTCITPPSPCQLPTTKKVDEAFLEVEQSINRRACWYRFSQYRDRLIEIAAGDPHKEHRQLFAKLYRAGVNLGILTSRQAKMEFTGYFTSSFAAALPEDGRLCSTLTQGKGQLLHDLQEEMDKKKEGLMRALGDTQGYHDAQRFYSDLVYMIEVNDAACNDQS